MEEFSRARARFREPKQARLSLTIAGNDLQRDLMPAGFRAGAGKGGGGAVPARDPPTPTADILREGGCDLLVTALSAGR